MNKPISNKIILYSALFITAVICTPQLIRLQGDGLRNYLFPFNMTEWVIRVIIEFCFCICIFFANKKHLLLFRNNLIFLKNIRLILINFGILILFSAIGGSISHLFITRKLLPLNGYFFRLTITLFFILIELKIIATLYYASQKEKENEQLRRINTEKELEILKQQINPHFLFNTLSSLSAVIRENPAKAQNFVSHLSKIFRYSLSNNNKHLVSLGEELEKLKSYVELINMRMEDTFILTNEIPFHYYDYILPQTALLPLIENAVKHNIATKTAPLNVLMKVEGDELIVQNNIQPKIFPEEGTGIGLTNLNDRFKILLGTEISIQKNNNLFIVKLPLKK